MKPIILNLTLLFGTLPLIAQGPQSASPVHGQTVSFSLKNNSGKDFIISGDIIGDPSYLQNGTGATFQFTYDINNLGPSLKFILPNDLILYAQNSDTIDAELRKTKPNFTRLKDQIHAHISSSRPFYTLEGSGGLRRGEYTAKAHDAINLEKNESHVIGSSGFKSNLRLVRKNN